MAFLIRFAILTEPMQCTRHNRHRDGQFIHSEALVASLGVIEAPFDFRETTLPLWRRACE